MEVNLSRLLHTVDISQKKNDCKFGNNDYD